jgi:hypothetical protein
MLLKCCSVNLMSIRDKIILKMALKEIVCDGVDWIKLA